VTREPDHRRLLGTFVALLVLTSATWGLSTLPLGSFQVAVALAIALAKATLVALFFMHLAEAPRVFGPLLAVPLALVVIFVGLTAADVATRGATPGRADASQEPLRAARLDGSRAPPPPLRQ
jgi:cytochrome c oxidase subunit 4